MAFLDLGQYKPRNGYRPGMAARHMHARVHGFSINWAVIVGCIVSAFAWGLITLGVIAAVIRLGLIR